MKKRKLGDINFMKKRGKRKKVLQNVEICYKSLSEKRFQLYLNFHQCNKTDAHIKDYFNI